MPDVYDNRYADDVAGHVEAGSFITDDAVSTTHGLDEFFTGNDVHNRDAHRALENVGSEATNKAIGETVSEAQHRNGQRRPVNNSGGRNWRAGNVTLQNSQAVRLVVANAHRRDVVVTNQSTALLYVGRDSGLIAAGPNTAYLPANTASNPSRVFSHTGDIWVVGVAGQVVDFVETNY